MASEEVIRRAARDITKATRIIAFTGAGISVESEIAPFRGKSGLWERYNPEEYAHINTFRKNPEKSWQMLVEMLTFIKKAKPNPAHLALAELEKLGKLRCIITQNVDNLHQKAGSTSVIDFHGNTRWLVCLECGRKYKLDEVSLEEIPPRCECSAVLKPDAVFFGEPIPKDVLRRSQEEASKCDLILVIGTSAVIQPAASLPAIAKRAGATVIEINPEPAPGAITGIVSDYLIEGKAGEVLPRIVEKIGISREIGFLLPMYE